MHTPKYAFENETPKIHWDFEIQTDHSISARWPDLMLVFTSPSRISIFKEEYSWMKNFPSHRLVAAPAIKNQVYPTIASRRNGFIPFSWSLVWK